MNNVNTRKFVYKRKLICNFPKLYLLLLLLSSLLIFAEPSSAQPTAVVNVGSNQNVGYTVCFDGSQSYGDNNDIFEIAHYTWKFGDGSQDEGGKYLNTTTHVYNNPGNYTVTLTVIDYSGGTDTTSTTVTVGTLPRITVSGNTSSAIMSAINALGGNPGIVYLPAGNYSVTSEIRIPSNTIIEGTGTGLTILHNNYSGYVFRLNGNNSRVTSLEIAGPGSGYYATYCSSNNFYIDHCDIHGFRIANSVTYAGSATFEYNYIHNNPTPHFGYGIMVTTAAYAMIRYNDFSNNRHSVASGGYLHELRNTGYDFLQNHIYLDNNTAIDVALDVHPGGHGRVRISDNIIENIHYGIGLKDSWGEIKRNVFRNVSSYVMKLGTPTHNGSFVQGAGAYNVDIGDNTFINCGLRYKIEYGTDIYLNCRNIDGLIPYFGNATWNDCGSVFTISTSSLPNGSVHEPYSVALQAANGRPPFVWSLIDGTLPDGLQLSSSGTINGTPVRVQRESFTVRAADANDNSAEKRLSAAINDSPVPPDTDLEVPPTEGAAIDGNLAEFSNVNGVSFADNSSRGGAQNNSVVAKAMWDDTYLYVGLEVTDTQLNAIYNEGDKTSGLWQDDCVEIFIDPNNDGGATMANDDYRYTVSIKEIVLDGSGFTGWSWDGHIVKKVCLTGTLNFNSDTDTGYTIEVAIPWTDLGISPVVGKIFGLQIGVTDRDAESGYEYFGWAIDNSSFNNPDGWAKVELTGNSSDFTNRPPVISSFTATPAILRNPGEEVTFQITANDPDGDSLTYSINFGDGSNGVGNVSHHTYEAEGICTAEASVDDGHDHTASQTLHITVEDLVPAPPAIVNVR